MSEPLAKPVADDVPAAPIARAPGRVIEEGERGGRPKANRAIDRLANLGWGAIGAAPLMAAGLLLTPAAEGVGTHRQLGLPPCTFLYLTGFPCAFCGMTTSWTHAAHGHLLSSITTQPMGFVLFAIDLGLVVWLLGQVIAGRPGFRPENLLSSIPRWLWWSALAVTLGSWAYKITVVRGWI